MNSSMPGLPVHHHLPEFTQTHLHRVHDAIQPSHPRSSPSPPAPNPSQHQSLSNESTFHMGWPKYWSFSLSIIPSKEIPGLISFRMDWLDPLAVQGSFKSLLQHHSSKASILWHSAFFMESLLMKVKNGSEKAGLKLNIKKTKIMASSPITSWQINGKIKWKH